MKALCAAVLGVVVGSASAAAQAQQALLAADRGTHLEPIAQFDGSRWSALPASGPARVTPRQWTRWYPDGSSGAVRVEAGEPGGRCSEPRRLSIVNPPRRGGASHGFAGIAATRPIAVDPLSRFAADSRDAARIVKAVAPIFDRRAREQGVMPSALARVPLVLDWLYRAGPGTYYFEASKRIADAGGTPEEDPRGVVRVGLSGWMREDRTGLAAIGTRSDLQWEPEEAAPSTQRPGLLPLGVLQQGDARIWVMSERAGTRERFVLYEVGTTVRRLFEVESGAC